MNLSASADWHNINALSADRQFLTRCGQSGLWGHIEHCFNKAVNIVCPQGHRRFTLLVAGSDNAPNSCRLAIAGFSEVIRPGDAVYGQGNTLIIGRRRRIDFRTCQLWQPEKPFWKNDVIRAFHQQRLGETLALMIYREIPQNASLFDYCSDNIFYRQLAKQLSSARGQLISGLKNRARSQSEGAFRQLLGAGIGLTPSGDDYLVGLASLLFIDGHPGLPFYDDFCRWLEKYRQHTTPLSAITLQEALRQHYREVMHLLIAKLTLGCRNNIQREIQGVMKIGSSSGCDMLYGMADALLLTQYFGGEYVNQDRD